MRALSGCGSLKTFNVADNSFGDKAGPLLAELLKTCPSLDTLRCNSCQLGPAAVQNIEATLATIGRKVNLDISDNKVKKEEVDRIHLLASSTRSLPVIMPKAERTPPANLALNPRAEKAASELEAESYRAQLSEARYFGFQTRTCGADI